MKKSQKKSTKTIKSSKTTKRSPRMRVYELSKELNLSSNALIGLLRKLNFDVKNHMSTLSDDMIKSVKNKLETEKKILKVKEIERKKKIKKKEESKDFKKREEERLKRKKKKRQVIEKKKEEIEKKVKETVGKITGISKPKKIKK